ncbi:MAG: DEAD/DEAH box helicase [Steroidobacteraceae bacterium]
MTDTKITSRRLARRSKKKTAEAPSLSHRRPPGDLSVAEWQRRLRRQFGRRQSFAMRNIGDEPVFSEFLVANPVSGNDYRVAVRGTAAGENFCSCPDFATNELGTCKHVEFVVGRLERTRGGKTALARGFHPAYSEIYLQYGGERQVRFRRGTGCPSALAKRAAGIFAAAPAGALARSQFPALEEFLAAAQKTGHEVRCYEDALALVAQARDAQARRRILDEAYAQGARSAGLEKLLKAPLYRYQAEAALFAVRAGRCLIGDEMGLGKTIQAIAAVELFARHFGAERVLVVCPTSLKTQWQREIRRFTDRDARVINGLRAARADLYHAAGSCKITNYETVAKDLDLITSWSPDVVIVDEAQRIKNWNTVAARALKRVSSPYAIVLTGTPLENRLEELVSIVQFVDQHRLGATWRLQHEHQVRDATGRVVGYRGLDRIGRTLAPILLRRRKSEVLSQLPPRVDNTVFVPMTGEQMNHHEENREIVARIVARWRKTGYLSDADQRRLTCCLQNMRMSCNSTYLLDHKTDHGAKADELATLLEELFERPDAKAVIFSQWVRTHELIIRRLKPRGWDYVLFHGSVPGEKRAALVDRFCSDPACRVFLSTDAGGLGLNLQHAASTVINMDLPWNPAVLEQRIGRVHRMGQARGVQVVNFVAEGTIEQGMLSVLAFKKSLFAGVLDGGESEVFLNGSRLSKFMETVEAVTSPGGEAQSQEAGLPRAQRSQSQGAAPAQGALQAGAVVDSESSGGAPDVAAAASSSSGASPAVDAWLPLLDAGVKLVEALAAASRGDGNGSGGTSSPFIETDPRTGRAYLKLPMPEPKAMQQLAAALTKLISGFAAGGGGVDR